MAQRRARLRCGQQGAPLVDRAGPARSDTEYLIGAGDGIDLLDLHVGLGVMIMVLGVCRVGWRRVVGLPPWAAVLSPRARAIESWTEKVLLGSLFLVPGTGLTLVLTQDDAFVPLHVGALLLLAAAVTVHVGLVLRYTLTGGRLLSRMLPGS